MPEQVPANVVPISEKAALQRDGRDVERAYEAMLGDIISGALPPGCKLNEQELAGRFGVKRGPLREAIRMLQGRSLVVCKPNAGARVVTHSPKEVLDTYEMRELLESHAARLCAEHMTNAEIAELKRITERARSGSADPSQRTLFHAHIVSGSRNQVIAKMLNEDFFQLLKLWQANYPWLRHGGSESWSDHERIAEAIAYHDGDTAELLMRKHLRRLREVILRNLHESGQTELSDLHAPAGFNSSALRFGR